MDGLDGEHTAVAVLAFQQDNNLAADGLVGKPPTSPCHLTGEAFDGYFAGYMNTGVMETMADFAVAQGIGDSLS